MFLKRFISSFVIAACISQLHFTSIKTAFVENNPLHVAITHADPILLHRVLERPDQTAIFINQPSDDTGETPLYLAVKQYLLVNFEDKALLRNTIKELLKHGANVNNPNTDGSTVLNLPGYKGYQLLVQLAQEINLEKQKLMSYKPNDSLFNYIKLSSLRGVQEYLKKMKEAQQKNPNLIFATESDEFANDPLHIAIMTDSPSLEIIEELLNSKTINNQINETNIFKETPLHLAMLQYQKTSKPIYKDIIKLLMINGASPDIKINNQTSIRSINPQLINEIIEEIVA